jgi:hypothetical protein
MLKNFARTMVCISFVFAAAPSFAGFVIDNNNGTLHAQENFGGGNLVVSVGNFSSNHTYFNVSFTVLVCTDLSETNCQAPERGSMGAIAPGATVRMTVAAPPRLCYFTTIVADGGTAIIHFPGYCVGT